MVETAKEIRYITDIFGNRIYVENLKEAIKQTKIHVGWSEDVDMSFNEFKLIKTVDQWKQPMTIKREVKGGRVVTFLEFYKHQLKELLSLTGHF